MSERAEPKLEPRVPSAKAAVYLGVSRRHVVKLIHRGTLTGWDMRDEGAKRPAYVVTVSSIRDLLIRRQVTESSMPSIRDERSGATSRPGLRTGNSKA